MNVRIELTYRAKKGIELDFYSDNLPIMDALELANDLEKTGRIKEIMFIDEYDSQWTYQQLKKFVEKMKTEPHNFTIYFDGGYDHTTKNAGLGCAIYYEQDNKFYRIRKNAFIKGLVSNNEAEYAALHLGLTELELLGIHHVPVTFVGDSLVVINQLNDEWPCYEKELASWMDRIEGKIDQLGIRPLYKNVSRKLNREADHLASQALEGKEITSHIEIIE